MYVGIPKNVPETLLGSEIFKSRYTLKWVKNIYTLGFQKYFKILCSRLMNEEGYWKMPCIESTASMQFEF